MPLNPTVPCYGKTSTGANEAIGCTTPTAATQALTLSGNANEGETFTIGLTVYTWTAIAANYTGQTANYVKIGVDAAASITNAAAAITGTASKGTLFSNNTRPNPLVTAVATSSTVLTITAKNPGADGNGIATTDTMANAAWGAATTAGGVSSALFVTGPTPGGTTVVGIKEVDTWATKSADYSAAAGALSILFNPSSDFVGTVNGITWSGSAGTAANQGAVSRTAQPGNILPIFAVTRSAGTFLMAEARPV